MDEMYKLRLAAIKREEDHVRAEEERLNNEKLRHVRLLKRVRDEDSSRFGGLGLLSKRYQMLNLLGKGGFSEVFKCYDLQDMCFVACKVHQLNPHWSDVKKQSYVKHAVREYEIHKGLHHPNIVGLLDIIEIDNASFATILDLCEGPDLDSILREQGTLPEKEAKSIIAQVFRALVHLNQPRHKIIHYDLKPANVLFDSLGMVKVTDFGLSKIMEEGNTQLGGMELTSQGAGTYWYLPPECFELNGTLPPRISNKVDVWSAGVILFQMIYGRRPFGEGMTQEQIARERVIVLNAKDPIDFPSKPSASPEAKEFIRKCLTYKQETRWDVMAAAADPYLCLTKAAASAALAAQQQQQQQQGGGGGGGGSKKGSSGTQSGFGGLLESMLVPPND